MNDHGNLKDFFEESRQLIKSWAETKMEIYKLRLVKAVSLVTGNLVWMLILLFLLTLLVIFAGVTAGYWFSELFNSYVKGFGLVTLILLFFVILLVLLRKVLFINPIIRILIKQLFKEDPKP